MQSYLRLFSLQVSYLFFLLFLYLSRYQTRASTTSAKTAHQPTLTRTCVSPSWSQHTTYLQRRIMSLIIKSSLISSYFDRPEVRVQLGVDASVTSNFSVCSASVEKAFSMTMDEYRPTYNYVAALLERNVSVLIWVGTYDWICNHVANEAWTLNLDWSGKEPFSTQPLRSWYIDGKSIGKTRSANGLTYATLEGAGHLVCFNTPDLHIPSNLSCATGPLQ